MKKRIVTAALLAVLTTVAVSCQKETVVEPQCDNTEMSTVYTVRYTVNGVAHTERLYTDAEYDALILRLLALTREGYEVMITDGNNPVRESLSKEVITYNTPNENDAIAWIKQKLLEGYKVSMTFNEETGE